MDREQEFIRSSDWGGLRQHYSENLSGAWGQAWDKFLVSPASTSQSIPFFRKSLRDPHFEQASSIMLRYLKSEPLPIEVLGPTSLRFYDAYLRGELRSLSYFLLQKPAHFQFASFLLDRVLESKEPVTESVLQSFGQVQSWSPLAKLKLARIWEKRFPRSLAAEIYFSDFYKDPWSMQALKDFESRLLDANFSKRIHFAYSQKDGLSLKRYFQALLAKIEKISEDDYSLRFKKAAREAVLFDQDHLSAHLKGFAFWNLSVLSPWALKILKDGVFEKESEPAPLFVRSWDQFFQQKKLQHIPLDADPESLALWQIAVEVNPAMLSEALLKFPNQERFLFLWSTRGNQLAKVASPLKWPSDRKEAAVVRQNLERAFRQSSNKLLWFSRLRSAGCSQDFYEFTLDQIDIPLAWILEDLRSRLIEPSAKIRECIRSNLSVVTPGQSSDRELKVQDILEGLQYLTPVEIQEVLVSRYILSELPLEILDSERMDLFWDARNRVGEEVFESWVHRVVQYIQQIKRENWSAQHWDWIQEAWRLDRKYLKTFSPRVKESPDFPWICFLTECQRHSEDTLLLTSLILAPDQRYKSVFLEELIERDQSQQILKAIDSLESPQSRAALKSRWHEKNGNLEKALEFRRLELDEAAILNDRPPIILKIISLLERLPVKDQEKYVHLIDEFFDELKRFGLREKESLDRMAQLMENMNRWDKAWESRLSEWELSDRLAKLEFLDRIAEASFRARKTSELQKVFVDFIFQEDQVDALSHRVLDLLIDEDSLFSVQHLRKEFIEKACRISPLKERLLKARAAYDYRAFVIWRAFYREDLESVPTPPVIKKNRGFKLWGMLGSFSVSTSLHFFKKYIHTLPLSSVSSEKHRFSDEAQKSLLQIGKKLGLSSKPKLMINSKLESVLRLNFEPLSIELQPQFFEEFDQEIWEALCFGVYQISEDRNRGLFNDTRLVERFFQAMMLSGTPVPKVLRFMVWLSISEGVVDSSVIELSPSEMAMKLDFLNSLVALYLSSDFLQLQKECGIHYEGLEA